MREFLHDVGSDLLEVRDLGSILRQMQVVRRVNGHEAPRNVALLFFADDPDRWFRGARIEVVTFIDDVGGDVRTEHFFRGPVQEQLRDAIRYLEGLVTGHIQKLPDQFTARGWLDYPVPALREALANAVYHRSYDVDIVEPTKVYLYPNRIEVISYPGPVAGISVEHFQGLIPMPQIPARNRRIGEYLKELRLAEARFTGIPKIRRAMADNGSPEPSFDFDAGRTYFRITLPAHPDSVAITALRDSAYLRGLGDDRAALERLRHAWEQNQGQAALANELVRELARSGAWLEAERALEAFLATGPNQLERVISTLVEAYQRAGREHEAERLRQRLPSPTS